MRLSWEDRLPDSRAGSTAHCPFPDAAGGGSLGEVGCYVAWKCWPSPCDREEEAECDSSLGPSETFGNKKIPVNLPVERTLLRIGFGPPPGSGCGRKLQDTLQRQCSIQSAWDRRCVRLRKAENQPSPGKEGPGRPASPARNVLGTSVRPTAYQHGRARPAPHEPRAASE